MHNKEDKEIQGFLESKKHKRNMNAFFREDIGIWNAPHPEVDNSFERLRSKVYLNQKNCCWVSRLRKSRKRRNEKRVNLMK